MAGAELPVKIRKKPSRKRLSRARKQRKMSQELLGFESGYHRTYISMLERGKRNPTLRTMLSLAAALSIPASQLVHDVEAAWVAVAPRPTEVIAKMSTAPPTITGRTIHLSASSGEVERLFRPLPSKR